MNRILVIRGGAIGDFVLTLPAIKSLRDGFPTAHLEILGYKHIAALAEKRFYADAVRSIESASLARFFSKDSELPADLREYFGRFELIVSYLYDPDAIFETNVRRCGKAEFVAAPGKLDNSAHAAVQLAAPLERIGFAPTDFAARLYPSDSDRDAVAQFRRGDSTITVHPGSGSETKNWALEKWRALGHLLLERGHALIVVAGEADSDRLATLKTTWAGKPVQFAENLPLPDLAALLERRNFIGHDSGISHMAAAVEARCLLLFGWTDPAVWAPQNKNVTVLRAAEGRMDSLEVETVAASYELMRIGIRT